MSPDDYKEFESYRAVGFLYKGRRCLCRWINAPKEFAQEKELLECIVFILKYTLRKIIEDAIKNRSPLKKLHIIASPITKAEIVKLIDQEKEIIKEKIRKIVQILYGYNLFKKDKIKYSEGNSVKIIKKKRNFVIEINKEILDEKREDILREWNNTSDNLKIQYKLRNEGESEIKKYLRRANRKDELDTNNEYTKFVIKEIEQGKIKKVNSKFFYHVFQKWLAINKI